MKLKWSKPKEKDIFPEFDLNKFWKGKRVKWIQMSDGITFYVKEGKTIRKIVNHNKGGLETTAIIEDV